MDDPQLEPTEARLLRALREALEESDGDGEAAGALTTKQLSDKLGVSIHNVYKALDILGDRVECVYVRMMDRARRFTPRPAYRIREEEGRSNDQPSDDRTETEDH